MTKKELLKLLENIPDDGEICIIRGDDILGDYYCASDLSIIELEAYGAGGWTSYSNYRRIEDKPKKVWVIE